MDWDWMEFLTWFSPGPIAGSIWAFFRLHKQGAKNEGAREERAKGFEKQLNALGENQTQLAKDMKEGFDLMRSEMLDMRQHQTSMVGDLGNALRSEQQSREDLLRTDMRALDTNLQRSVSDLRNETLHSLHFRGDTPPRTASTGIQGWVPVSFPVDFTRMPFK